MGLLHKERWKVIEGRGVLGNQSDLAVCVQVDAEKRRERTKEKKPPADIRRFLKPTGLMETRYIRMLSSLCADTYMLSKLSVRPPLQSLGPSCLSGVHIHSCQHSQNGSARHLPGRHATEGKNFGCTRTCVLFTSSNNPITLLDEEGTVSDNNLSWGLQSDTLFRKHRLHLITTSLACERLITSPVMTAAEAMDEGDGMAASLADVQEMHRRLAGEELDVEEVSDPFTCWTASIQYKHEMCLCVYS
jgi:hypothetical protein